MLGGSVAALLCAGAMGPRRGPRFEGDANPSER